jgi:plastocyanin
MEAHINRGARNWLATFACAIAALLLFSPLAHAGVGESPGQCPTIADKPGEVPHVNYPGVQHLTYCFGPIDIMPGQNTINLRPAVDAMNQKLWPQEDGYITRFDPEFVYADGSVPRVDVLHLHHAVWLVNGGPQFAAGEEKTIQQLPQGFGWPNYHDDGAADPDTSDSWLLNDMLHDLVAQPAKVYLVWRLDFVPADLDTPGAIKPVHTKWMDVAGNPSLYPVFDSLRSNDHNGTYTFPDQAPAADVGPCTGTGRPKGAHGCLGDAQSWTPSHAMTLIGTAGHLHPGGLDVQLRDTRGTSTNTLFTSDAHYYEPAGEVSWDVSMGATPASWQVQVEPGDHVSVHATYDTRRADWYEVMGIMPVAVYDGTLAGSQNAQAAACTAPNTPPGCIPQDGVLTHTHLTENDNHGGGATGVADPLSLPSAAVPGNTIGIQQFAYQTNPNAGLSVPTIQPGQALTFRNDDAVANTNAFHTITACLDPCTAKTGIAYPISNGPVTFDSGELGYNGNNGSIPIEPAADRATWQTPQNLPAGTYSYFCRIHPFMRGAFRVEPQSKPRQKLTARKKQRLGTAAVIEKVDKPATVKLQAKVKPAGGAASSSGRSRALSRALDAKRSTSLAANVSKKIKLRFSKAARKMIRARGGRWKVVVTATATTSFGVSSTAKTRFTLTG